MRHMLKKLSVIASNKKVRFFAKVIFAAGIFSLTRYAFADTSTDASDLLAGTTAQAVTTIGGTGRKWIYLIDGGISLAAFTKSKNPYVFASVFAAAIFITVMVKMAT